jgi:pyrrolidone-carboxylate peptidase
MVEDVEMGRLLVTGYGSFGEFDANPSDAMVESMRSWPELAGARFEVLEVSYAAVDEFLADLEESSFDTWLMMGVNGRGDSIQLETVGRNRCHGVADVRGVVAGPGVIDPGLPPMIAGSWFDESMVGERVVTSVEAGLFLCNYLYFRALAKFEGKRIGFLHVLPFDRMGVEDQLAVVRRVLGGGVSAPG